MAAEEEGAELAGDDDDVEFQQEDDWTEEEQAEVPSPLLAFLAPSQRPISCLLLSPSRRMTIRQQVVQSSRESRTASGRKSGQRLHIRYEADNPNI